MRRGKRRWKDPRRCVPLLIDWDRSSFPISQAASDDDADRSTSGPDDDEENGGYIVANGRGGHNARSDPKARSTSSTIHDRSRNGPDFGGIPANNASQHLQQSSSSQQHSRGNHSSSPSSSSNHLLAPQGGIPPFASPYGASPSSSTAKESFLNYFFGGSEMNPNGDSRGGQRGLPDMRGAGQGRAERDDNPLSGRRGLEGNAAAFDMKSLDKHLEAVSCSDSSEVMQLTLPSHSHRPPQTSTAMVSPTERKWRLRSSGHSSLPTSRS